MEIKKRSLVGGFDQPQNESLNDTRTKSINDSTLSNAHVDLRQEYQARKSKLKRNKQHPDIYLDGNGIHSLQPMTKPVTLDLTKEKNLTAFSKLRERLTSSNASGEVSTSATASNLSEVDKCALEVGQMVLKTILKKPELSISDNLNRFFIDSWLEGFKSNANEASDFSIRLLADLQRAIAEVTTLVPFDDAHSDTPKYTKPSNFSESMLSKTLCGLGMEAYDELLTELQASNPILHEIKRTLLPAIFSEFPFTEAFDGAEMIHSETLFHDADESNNHRDLLSSHHGLQSIPNIDNISVASKSSNTSVFRGSLDSLGNIDEDSIIESADIKNGLTGQKYMRFRTWHECYVELKQRMKQNDFKLSAFFKEKDDLYNKIKYLEETNLKLKESLNASETNLLQTTEKLAKTEDLLHQRTHDLEQLEIKYNDTKLLYDKLLTRTTSMSDASNSRLSSRGSHDSEVAELLRHKYIALQEDYDILKQNFTNIYETNCNLNHEIEMAQNYMKSMAKQQQEYKLTLYKTYGKLANKFKAENITRYHNCDEEMMIFASTSLASILGPIENPETDSSEGGKASISHLAIMPVEHIHAQLIDYLIQWNTIFCNTIDAYQEYIPVINHDHQDTIQSLQNRINEQDESYKVQVEIIQNNMNEQIQLHQNELSQKINSLDEQISQLSHDKEEISKELLQTTQENLLIKESYEFNIKKAFNDINRIKSKHGDQIKLLNEQILMTSNDNYYYDKYVQSFEMNSDIQKEMKQLKYQTKYYENLGFLLLKEMKYIYNRLSTMLSTIPSDQIASTVMTPNHTRQSRRGSKASAYIANISSSRRNSLTVASSVPTPSNNQGFNAAYMYEINENIITKSNQLVEEQLENMSEMLSKLFDRLTELDEHKVFADQCLMDVAQDKENALMSDEDRYTRTNMILETNNEKYDSLCKQYDDLLDQYNALLESMNRSGDIDNDSVQSDDKSLTIDPPVEQVEGDSDNIILSEPSASTGELDVMQQKLSVAASPVSTSSISQKALKKEIDSNPAIELTQTSSNETSDTVSVPIPSLPASSVSDEVKPVSETASLMAEPDKSEEASMKPDSSPPILETLPEPIRKTETPKVLSPRASSAAQKDFSPKPSKHAVNGSSKLPPRSTKACSPSGNTIKSMGINSPLERRRDNATAKKQVKDKETNTDEVQTASSSVASNDEKVQNLLEQLQAVTAEYNKLKRLYDDAMVLSRQKSDHVSSSPNPSLNAAVTSTASTKTTSRTPVSSTSAAKFPNSSDVLPVESTMIDAQLSPILGNKVAQLDVSLIPKSPLSKDIEPQKAVTPIVVTKDTDLRTLNPAQYHDFIQEFRKEVNYSSIIATDFERESQPGPTAKESTQAIDKGANQEIKTDSMPVGSAKGKSKEPKESHKAIPQDSILLSIMEDDQKDSNRQAKDKVKPTNLSEESARQISPTHTVIVTKLEKKSPPKVVFIERSSQPVAVCSVSIQTEWDDDSDTDTKDDIITPDDLVDVHVLDERVDIYPSPIEYKETNDPSIPSVTYAVSLSQTNQSGKGRLTPIQRQSPKTSVSMEPIIAASALTDGLASKGTFRLRSNSRQVMKPLASIDSKGVVVNTTLTSPLIPLESVASSSVSISQNPQGNALSKRNSVNSNVGGVTSSLPRTMSRAATNKIVSAAPDASAIPSNQVNNAMTAKEQSEASIQRDQSVIAKNNMNNEELTRRLEEENKIFIDLVRKNEKRFAKELGYYAVMLRESKQLCNDMRLQLDTVLKQLAYEMNKPPVIVETVKTVSNGTEEANGQNTGSSMVGDKNKESIAMSTNIQNSIISLQQDLAKKMDWLFDAQKLEKNYSTDGAACGNGNPMIAESQMLLMRQYNEAKNSLLKSPSVLALSGRQLVPPVSFYQKKRNDIVARNEELQSPTDIISKLLLKSQSKPSNTNPLSKLNGSNAGLVPNIIQPQENSSRPIANEPETSLDRRLDDFDNIMAEAVDEPISPTSIDGEITPVNQLLNVPEGDLSRDDSAKDADMNQAIGRKASAESVNMEDIKSAMATMESLDKVSEDIMQRAYVHGGWKSLLYTTNGNMNPDFDLSLWPTTDQVDILHETVNYERKKNTSLQRQLDLSVSNYEKNVQSLREKNDMLNDAMVEMRATTILALNHANNTNKPKTAAVGSKTATAESNTDRQSNHSSQLNALRPMSNSKDTIPASSEPESQRQVIDEKQAIHETSREPDDDLSISSEQKQMETLVNILGLNEVSNIDGMNIQELIEKGLNDINMPELLQQRDMAIYRRVKRDILLGNIPSEDPIIAPHDFNKLKSAMISSINILRQLTAMPKPHEIKGIQRLSMLKTGSIGHSNNLPSSTVKSGLNQSNVINPELVNDSKLLQGTISLTTRRNVSGSTDDADIGLAMALHNKIQSMTQSKKALDSITKPSFIRVNNPDKEASDNEVEYIRLPTSTFSSKQGKDVAYLKVNDSKMPLRQGNKAAVSNYRYIESAARREKAMEQYQSSQSNKQQALGQIYEKKTLRPLSSEGRPHRDPELTGLEPSRPRSSHASSPMKQSHDPGDKHPSPSKPRYQSPTKSSMRQSVSFVDMGKENMSSNRQHDEGSINKQQLMSMDITNLANAMMSSCDEIVARVLVTYPRDVVNENLTNTKGSIMSPMNDNIDSDIHGHMKSGNNSWEKIHHAYNKVFRSRRNPLYPVVYDEIYSSSDVARYAKFLNERVNQHIQAIKKLELTLQHLGENYNKGSSVPILDNYRTELDPNMHSIVNTDIAEHLLDRNGGLEGYTWEDLSHIDPPDDMKNDEAYDAAHENDPYDISVENPMNDSLSLSESTISLNVSQHVNGITNGEDDERDHRMTDVDSLYPNHYDGRKLVYNISANSTSNRDVGAGSVHYGTRMRRNQHYFHNEPAANVYPKGYVGKDIYIKGGDVIHHENNSDHVVGHIATSKEDNLRTVHIDDASSDEEEPNPLVLMSLLNRDYSGSRRGLTSSTTSKSLKERKKGNTLTSSKSSDKLSNSKSTFLPPLKSK